MASAAVWNPLVTVVIPVHDGTQTLDAAIESVLTQSYEHLELVVVDDGSSDGSAHLAQQWQERDCRVTVIQLSPASGSPNRPRNVGIASSSGELVALLDHDDMWLADKLLIQVERLLQTGAAVCYSRCVVDDLTGSGEPDDYHCRWTPELGALPEGDVVDALLVSDVVPCCTAVFRRRLYDELGGFTERLPATSDYEFWLRASLSGASFCAVEVPTAVYRWSINNLSHQSSGKRVAYEVDLWEGVRRLFPSDARLREKARQARAAAASERLYFATRSGLSRGERARSLWGAACLRPPPKLIWFHVRRVATAARRRSVP